MTDYSTIKIPDLTLKQIADLSGSEDVQVVVNGVNYRVKSSGLINDVETTLTSTSDSKQLAASQGKELKDLSDWQNRADGIIYNYSAAWTLTPSGLDIGVSITSCEILEPDSSTPISVSATTGTISENGGLTITKSGSTYVYAFVDDLTTITQGNDKEKYVIVQNIGGILYTRIPSVGQALVGGTDSFDYLDFIPQTSNPTYNEGRFFYQDDEKCMAVMNDRSNTLRQLGREIGDRCLNDTGSTISNGQVVYVSGDNGTVRTIALADASDSEKALGTIGFATEEIVDGDIGEITFIGKVRGLNTTGCTVGEILYLSTTPGAYTNTSPESPNYRVILGNCGRVDSSNGEIDAKIIPENNTGSIIKYYNGSILEDHSIIVASNGTTITLSLEKSGGGDLSLFFDGGFTIFSSTPAATVSLTAGTDSVPVRNWIYIPKSTNTLTANTTGFPTNEQIIPVADIYAQSATGVQTDGCYKVHAWTDHLSDTIGQGHLYHINYWIRKQSATYQTGIIPSVSITVNGGAIDNVYFSNTIGSVLQLHPHVFPALDMSVSDEMWVVNDFTTKYDKITDISSIDADSLGATLRSNNTYYSIFVYGVVSQENSDCKLFAKIPSGNYGNSTDALADLSNYNNKTIDSEFTGTGFAIALITLRYQTSDSGTITLINLENLTEASIGGGGSGGTSTSEFTDAAFKILNATDPTKIIQLDASAITTGTTRTYSLPNKAGTVAMVSDVVTRNYITPTVTTAVLTLDFDSKNEVFATLSGGGAIVVNEDITIAYSNATNFKSAFIVISITGATRIITFPATHKSSDARWTGTPDYELELAVGFYQISIMNNGSYKSVLCSQPEV